MNDEISVAELLVRDGWGERTPPPSRSRWRVLAVMIAVVVGCGTAAVLVAFGGKVRQDAQEVDQIRVIPMPERTTGLGGADQSTDSPSDGGIGGGTGGDLGPGTATRHGGTIVESTPPSKTGASASATTSAMPTATGTSPREDPPPPGASTTTASSSDTPPPPTTRHETCVLFICW